MLSIRNVHSAEQAAKYFEKDDYYLGRAQRSPSAWWGKGAAALRLGGPVGRAAFTALLGGTLPDGGALPGKIGGRRRAGLDLTFSAPKSVTLLALVAGRQEVIEAHEQAVEVALAYLEKHAAAARMTHGRETTTEATGNFVVARFNHDTSRSLDPQLHTHCVVLNLTRRQDGAWRALANEEIYRSKMMAGAIYRSEMAYTLGRAGYHIERTHADGRFEVRGFEEAQLGHFSQRREAVEAGLQRFREVLEGRGLAGAQAAEWVAVRTRHSKREVDRAALQATWRERAVGLGIDLATVGRAASERDIETGRAQDGSGMQHATKVAAPGPTDAVLRAARHFAERRAVFAHDEVMRRALTLSVGSTRLASLEQAAARLLQTGDLLSVVSERSAAQHYTTAAALAHERGAVEAMQRGRGAVAPIEVGLKTELFAGLTDEQRVAVTCVAQSRDRICGIQGYAGTGKTTLLRALSAAAQAAGRPIVGCAPSAAAAAVLEQEVGIGAQTLARHLIDQRCHGAGHAPAAPLWIVDEASFMGSRQAKQLFAAVERAGAKVVLVGDRDQLPSVEAGRIFETLAKSGMEVATLRDIKRQRELYLKKAVALTVKRRSPTAIRILDKVRADVVAAADPASAALDYLARAPELRQRTLLVTGANKARRTINETVRAGLLARGELGEAQGRAQVLVPCSLTEVERQDAFLYNRGDIVRFGRDYRRLGVAKDSYWQVTGRDGSKNQVTLRSCAGVELLWEPHRAEKVESYTLEERALAVGDVLRWTRNHGDSGRRNGEHARVVQLCGSTATVEVGRRRQCLDLSQVGHWDHGYCSTIHAAQGRTADELIMYIDTRNEVLTGHESWYVALSRARDRVRVYTDAPERLPQAVARVLKNESALESWCPPPRALSPPEHRPRRPSLAL